MLGIGITLNRCDINITWNNEMEKRKQKKWNTGNEGAGKRGYETSVMRGQNMYGTCKNKIVNIGLTVGGC